MKNKITPKPYQQDILDNLAFIPAIGLFMGTGSGKTFTSLFKTKEIGTKSLLIITPVKVQIQWEKSIKAFYPELEVVSKKKSWTAKKYNEFLAKVTNETPKAIIAPMSIIKDLSNLETLINSEYCIIVDESHKIKESGTVRKPVQVTKAVLKYKDRSPYKIILTATPTQKKYGGYIDYFTQLTFLGYFNMSLRDFKNRYCIEKTMQIPGQPFPIKTITGYKNTEEIEDILQMCAVRYIVKRYDDEPRHIKIDLDKPSSYNGVARENAYKDISLDNVSRKRQTLKYISGGLVIGENYAGHDVRYEDNKIKYDWLVEFLSNTDEVVSLFYCYNAELEVIKRACEKAGKSIGVINGKVAQDKKYKMINEEDYDVYVGQIAAMGESLDGLQHKCHISVFYSMPESSLQYVQALGRIDREGQEFLPTYYFLVCKGTLDQKIYTLIEEKVEFSEEILNKLTLEEK